MLASTTLPDNAGYVAAAYLVFLAIVLIYVGIMAYKLINIQREVVEIDELADRAAAAAPAAAGQRDREETPA
ncbi:MAG TPA: hypothetical protein VFG42_18075 [Baekduia sp.]|uniref:hypothetical protein n=1 Tax=Baekduia sp. TaxID=2600305 RepID=UPI002D775C5B|nr:hypothetical protein [Baekduia sp.]HET6508707.1 hypothetical protein [Baekduia sp.]